MTNENLRLLKDGTEAFNISLNEDMLESFIAYYEKLIEWNEKINLTAITEERDVVIKHFIDSLSLIKYFPDNVKSLIDVGTGAGFPGLPIKIVKKDIYVTLLDSVGKKVRFLDELASELSLTNVSIIYSRAEDLARDTKHREAYDVGTARAVASFAVLCEYILPFVKPGGFFIAMKGSDIQNELAEAKKAVSILGGVVEDVYKFTLPYENMERHIILTKKIRQTPSQYPRKSGKPSKDPIK